MREAQLSMFRGRNVPDSSTASQDSWIVRRLRHQTTRSGLDVQESRNGCELALLLIRAMSGSLTPIVGSLQ